MKPTYWLAQDDGPLFPDIEWNRPEQKSQAGKLLIIGGNKLGFAAVSQAYETALGAGIGETRVVLPDVLKKPLEHEMNCLFTASTASGGMSQESLRDIKSYQAWADGTLLIGESGRNAETAIIYEQLLGVDRPIIVTRDALDLVRHQAEQWLHNPQLCAVATFAQLQKLLAAVHYPKILLFRMQLAQLVEVLHKFTISYPAKIITLHQQKIIVASDGQVSTTPCDDALIIWRGTIATRAAVYWLQQPGNAFEALTTAMRI